MKKFRLSLIMIVFVLLSSSFLTFQDSLVNATGANWLTGWTYRKSHIINYAAGAGTLYQKQITVHYGSGNSGKITPITNKGYFYNFINPEAVYKNGKTYVSFFRNSDAAVMITYFDHTSKTWATPVVISTDSMIGWGTPCVNIDNSGYIHVFWAKKEQQVNYRKSTNPYDISAWTTMTAPSGTDKITAPNLLVSSTGTLYLLYRYVIATGIPGHYTIRIRKSIDGGSNWTDPVAGELVDFGNVDVWISYAWMDSNDTIHLLFLYSDSAVQAEFLKDVYYAKSADGITWKKADETTTSTPITLSNADKAVASTGHMTRAGDVKLDASGYPVILYSQNSGLVYGEGVQEWHIAKWNGTSWVIKNVGQNSGHCGEGWGRIDTIDGNTIKLCLDFWTPDKIQYFTTTDGGDNWSSGDLLSSGENPWGLFEVVNFTGIRYVWNDFTAYVLYAYGSDWKASDSDDDVYLNSHSRTDFGDVRFTDDDQTTLLDYWMESKVDSDNAVFWVEVADDLSTVNATIYVYYGKADATTTSSDFREDFTTYMESDPVNRITVNSALKATVANISIDDDITYLAADKGVNHFSGDFEHKIDVCVTSNFVGNDAEWIIWAVGDSLNDKDGVANELYTLLYRYGVDTTVGINILEKVAGTYYAATWFTTGAIGTIYYLTIKRAGTTFTNEIYSDSARTNLLATQTLTLHSILQYQYVYGVQALDTGLTDRASNGYCENLFQRRIVTPEPSHGSWGSEEQASTDYAVSYPLQVKTVIAGGYYYIFYSDGIWINWKSSSDGITFGAVNQLRLGLAEDFAVFSNGTTIHYAVSDGRMRYRRGTANAGGITWSGNEVNVTNDVYTAKYASICIDTNGKIWITYRAEAWVDYYYVAIFKSSDGVSWTSKYYDVESDGISKIIPLMSGKVYVSYSKPGLSEYKTIEGFLWNGTSWGSKETVATDFDEVGGSSFSWSAVSINDDIFFAYESAPSTLARLLYKKRVYGSGFTTETILENLTIGFRTYPTLSKSTNTIMMFYILDDNKIYLRYYTNTWSQKTNPFGIGTTQKAPYSISAFSERTGGKMGVTWVENETSVWTLKYGVLNTLTAYVLSVNDYRCNPSQTLTFSGYWYYDGTTTPPPDGDYQVKIKLSGVQKGSTDATLVSGYFSISDVTAENTVNPYSYTVEASDMSGAGSFSAVIVDSLTISHLQPVQYLGSGNYKYTARLDYDYSGLSIVGGYMGLKSPNGTKAGDSITNASGYANFILSQTNASSGVFTLYGLNETSFGLTFPAVNQTFSMCFWTYNPRDVAGNSLTNTIQTVTVGTTTVWTGLSVTLYVPTATFNVTVTWLQNLVVNSTFNVNIVADTTTNLTCTCYPYVIGGTRYWTASNATITSSIYISYLLTVKFSCPLNFYVLVASCPTRPAYILNVAYDYTTAFVPGYLVIPHFGNMTIVASYENWGDLYVKKTDHTIGSISWVGQRLNIVLNGLTGTAGEVDVYCIPRGAPVSTINFTVTSYVSGVLFGLYTFPASSTTVSLEWAFPVVGPGSEQSQAPSLFITLAFIFPKTVQSGATVNGALNVSWFGAAKVYVWSVVVEANYTKDWELEITRLPWTLETLNQSGLAQVPVVLYIAGTMAAGDYSVPCEVTFQTVEGVSKTIRSVLTFQVSTPMAEVPSTLVYVFLIGLGLVVTSGLFLGTQKRRKYSQ